MSNRSNPSSKSLLITDYYKDILVKTSIVPLLILTQLLAVIIATRVASKKNAMSPSSARWIYFIVTILAIWAGISTWLALSGVYLTEGFLATYPTFWLPFIPIIIVSLALIISETAWDAVRELIDATPMAWLVGIHALRILAIGSLIKAWQGKFALSFALYVGIPDLIFGLSALVVLKLLSSNRIGTKGLVVWNLVGFFAIIPGTPIVAQMGLPGALYTFTETPSITTLYEYPMVLAPSFVVPMFVMINLLVAFRLVEKSRGGK